jgi:hypothetical protein
MRIQTAVPPAAGTAPRSGPPRTLAADLAPTWPRVTTAVLVYHGIGDQQPFSTLDVFGRHLVLAAGGPDEISLEHHLVSRETEGSGRTWFDNCVRLRHRDHPEVFVDLYEYYWAHESRGQVPLTETLAFVKATAARGRKFYAQQKHAKSANEGRFSSFNYYTTLAVAWSVAASLPWLFGWAVRLLRMMPVVGAPLADWVKKWDFFLVGDLLGDVVAYVSSDRRSRHFSTRQRILSGSVDALIALLREAPPDRPDTRYGQVALVAHSLGTQIAIDTLNRLNLLATQRRLPAGCGEPESLARRLPLLFTFGSPADKLAFFFRDLSAPVQTLRRGIVASYHCFRQQNWERAEPGDPLADYEFRSVPGTRLLDGIRWVNIFSRRDLVSGHIDFYREVENVRVTDYSGLFPHSRYWEDDRLYREALRLLREPDAQINSPAAKPPRWELWRLHLALACPVVVVAVAVCALGWWWWRG